MLRFARRNPYAAWAILCLIVGVVLAVCAYADTSANFPTEAGLSEEILA